MTKFPPEIWDQIFQYLKLETKKQTRLVCTYWEKILQNKKQWENYHPVITNKPQVGLELSTKLVYEIRKGKYKNCKQIRYYPSVERQGHYYMIDRNEIIEGLEFLHDRISYMEKITSGWNFQGGTPRLSSYKTTFYPREAIPKYNWELGYKRNDKTENNNPETWTTQENLENHFPNTPRFIPQAIPWRNHMSEQIITATKDRTWRKLQQ